MLPLHVNALTRLCFFLSSTFFLGLGCSHRGFVQGGFSRQRFGGSPSKVRDPSGSRVFPINKGHCGLKGGMNDNDRIFEGWIAGLDGVFLFLLRFWGYCIFGIYGERLVFLGGFGRVGVGLRSLVIGLWG